MIARMMAAAPPRVFVSADALAAGLFWKTTLVADSLPRLRDLVARSLGFTVRVYDGSFIDWSRQAALPVTRGPVPR